MNNIKSKGEITSLFISITIALIFAIVISKISIEVLIIGLIFQLLYIIFEQKQIQGNCMKISESQYSKIYKIIEEYSLRLSITKPNSFITFDPYINAFVMGFKNPYTLVLTSSLIESMNEQELRYVIGHELGHIKYNHSRIKSLVMPIDRNIPFVTFFFNNWLRKAEYTADRVGLYLQGDLNGVTNAILKVAVGPKLSKDVNINVLTEHINTAFDQKTERIGEMFLTHPYVTNRINSLICFYKSNMINTVCKNCKSKIERDSKFCSNCGDDIKI